MALLAFCPAFSFEDVFFGHLQLYTPWQSQPLLAFRPTHIFSQEHTGLRCQRWHYVHSAFFFEDLCLVTSNHRHYDRHSHFWRFIQHFLLRRLLFGLFQKVLAISIQLSRQIVSVSSSIFFRGVYFGFTSLSMFEAKAICSLLFALEHTPYIFSMENGWLHNYFTVFNRY